MKKLSIDAQIIREHLKKHSELKSIEIAEDLNMSVSETEGLLGELKDKKYAREVYDTKKGYFWRVV